MRVTEKCVFFYGVDWPSNFAPSPITVDDEFWERGIWDGPEGEPPTITFSTAEAYFQSRKAVFVGDKYSYYKIAQASHPAETKRIGRGIKLDPVEWNKVRDEYMRETVRLKFEQNPQLMDSLLDPTFDKKTFVEASPTDKYWGIGWCDPVAMWHEGEWGENQLGEILTNFRLNELKKKG